MYYEDITELIGNTPLLRLKRVTGGIKTKVLAKLEFMNPGGSIKDRMASYMLEQLEKEGKLKKGGTIVEATSGNTGVGIAIYAAAKGYKMIFTIPDKMSQEKINLLKAFGAKVVVTPTAVPPDSPDSYYETAKRIHSEMPGSVMLEQYFNQKNPDAHYHSTGPEIWQQTEGKLDYIVIGIGTGGTRSGTAKYLKEKNPEIQAIGVDPEGSVFYDYFRTKKMIKPHPYLVEGIGEDMLCPTLHFDVMDDVIRVMDKDCFLMTRRLAREEGIFAGGSSGGIVWGALKVAEKLSEDKMVVAILPDSGTRYISKIFNDEWMKENGFLS